MSPGSTVLAVVVSGTAEESLLARPLGGLPLIEHALRCARACPEVDEIFAVTGHDEAARVATMFGAEVVSVPATGRAGAWAALRAAVADAVSRVGPRARFVASLDPCSVGTLPEDLSDALHTLEQTAEADGVLGVSRPEFNPIWHCVVERDGWMADYIASGGRYDRRQEVPVVYRVTGAVAIWSRAFVQREQDDWRKGRLVMHELPDWRIRYIGSEEDRAVTDALLQHGHLRLPWVNARIP